MNRRNRFPVVILILVVLFMYICMHQARAGKWHYFIQPSNTNVNTEETVNISIMKVDASDSNAKPVIVEQAIVKTFKWRINEHDVISQYKGPEGSLELLGAFAQYTAPLKVPAKNPVQVTVQVPGEDGMGKQILFANLKIVDAENSFTITGSDIIPNATYIQKTSPIGTYNQQQVTTGFGVYKAGDNILMINISTPIDPLPFPAAMVIWINGKTKGHYPWQINKKDPGNSTPECGFSLTVPVDPMHMNVLTSIDCHPQPDGNCQPYSLMGYCSITEVKNGKVKGFYEGKVMCIDQNGSRHFMEIAGNFNVALQDF